MTPRKPPPVLILSDADAGRLLAAALAAWSSQGEALASDADGRSWRFHAARYPAPGLAVHATLQGAADQTTVGQATMGADDVREIAVAGAIASVASRLQAHASAEA